MNDKNSLKHILSLLIGTSDSYSSDNMSVTPDHGNSNDDCTVTTHPVAVDDPPLDDDEMFNDPFAMPCSPYLTSLSSSSENENIVLPVFPKHVKTRSGGSSSVVTGKKTRCTSNTWRKCSAWRNNSICQKGSTTSWSQNTTKYSKDRPEPSRR